MRFLRLRKRMLGTFQLTGWRLWGGAPALLPQPPGERVHPTRRDAMPLARRARAGALTPGSGPRVDAAAIRDRTRARAATRWARQDAPCRLHACGLRQARGSRGRAPGGLAHLRGRAAGLGPTPAPPRVFQAEGRAVHAPYART
jgi:hypothetical protein